MACVNQMRKYGWPKEFKASPSKNTLAACTKEGFLLIWRRMPGPLVSLDKELRGKEVVPLVDSVAETYRKRLAEFKRRSEETFKNQLRRHFKLVISRTQRDISPEELHNAVEECIKNRMMRSTR